MPVNFPEFWLGRVKTNLTRADRAPWLAGIGEIDTPVLVSGSGDLSENNLIHIPVSEFEPDVLINNTAYPLALVDYNDSEATVKLDKYQTVQTSISDDAIIGASYNKVDAATASHTTAILKKKYSRAIHALAPAGNTTATPVLQSTGRSGKYNGATELILKDGNRLRLTYKDLVDFRKALTDAGVDMDGMRLVLCDDHWSDLLLDRDNFGDQLVNYKSGEVAPIVLGFKIYNYVNCPYYNGTTKLAFGAVPNTATQYRASVAFYEANVAIKTGLTKQYFNPASTDTANQSNKLNYRHYYICCPMRLKYIGAMASTYVAP